MFRLNVGTVFFMLAAVLGFTVTAALAEACSYSTATQNPAPGFPVFIPGAYTVGGGGGWVRTDCNQTGTCVLGTITGGGEAHDKRIDTVTASGTTGNPPAACKYIFTASYTISRTFTGTAYAHNCMYLGAYYDRGEGLGGVALYDDTGLAYWGYAHYIAIGGDPPASSGSTTAMAPITTGAVSSGCVTSTVFSLEAIATTSPNTCAATGWAQGYGYARYVWSGVVFNLTAVPC